MEQEATTSFDRREYRRISDWVGRNLSSMLHRAGMTPAEVASELWLGMKRREIGWESREHFENWERVAARHILTDRIRRLEKVQKVADEDPTRFRSRAIAVAETEETSFNVRDALQRLHRVYPRPASIASLRYLEGYTVPECAGRLGVSERTIKRESRRACSWLRGQFQ